MKNILLKTKSLINILTSLLFIFTIILPIINIILLFCFDYVVTVTNFTFYSAILAIISISLVIFSSRYGTIDYGKNVKIIMSLILPISLLLYSSYLLDIDSVYGYIFMFVYIMCCVFLTILYVRPLVLKILSIIISLLLMIPILTLTWFVFIFTLVDFTETKTLQTLISPDTLNVAYVIEHDAGATGGSTTVDVYENFKLDLLLFEIKKNGKRLYDGNWGEGRNMEVYWKDNDTLVINSIEYNIS